MPSMSGLMTLAVDGRVCMNITDLHTLQSGLALSVRSIVMMGTYVTATSLIASLGATTLAASEILRQVQSCSHSPLY